MIELLEDRLVKLVLYVAFRKDGEAFVQARATSKLRLIELLTSAEKLLLPSIKLNTLGKQTSFG